MIDDRASRTALSVAVMRALHQEVDRPLLFEDPHAVAILGAEGRAALSARRADPTASVRLRTMVVMRSMIAESVLAAAVARGTRQYVVLGAGLDTFGLRNPVPDLGVFEVDHPATQAWKRERLAEAGLVEPPGFRFVAVDFETMDLVAELIRAGFRFDRPAVFAFLGVVPYVVRPAAFATLAAIAGATAETEVVFDYSEPFTDAPEPVRAAYAAITARAAAAGEPWVSFYGPDDMERSLRAIGFVEVEDLHGASLAARGLIGRTDGLAPSPLGHVVHAANRPIARPLP